MNDAILTPYGAANLVNVVLEEVGLPTLPPQMFYNYTTARLRAGRKPAIAYTPESGIDRDDLQRWLSAYLVKKGVRQS
jgi:hypothetical protein